MKYREKGKCSMEVKIKVCAYTEQFSVASELNITNHLSLLRHKLPVKAVSVIYSVKRFSGKI
jgi:hypothetical protein